MFACKRGEAARARQQRTSDEESVSGVAVDGSATIPQSLRVDETHEEERGRCGSASGRDEDRTFAPYMVKLRGMQQLVAELLDVHALSRAIEYIAFDPLAVNAREWWEDVQRKSIAVSQRRKRLTRHTMGAQTGDAMTTAFARSVFVRERIGDLVGDAHDVVSIQDVCTEALFKILQCLDRVNRRKSCAASLSLASRNQAGLMGTIFTNVDDAIAFAAGQLLGNWDAFMAEEDSAATEFSVVVINMILQFCKIGSLHAFHPHVLVASSVRRVFGRATNWKCSVCTRYSEVKGPAAAPIVYRCAACDFNLCRECFTRIPNQSQQSEHPAIYLQEHLHVDRFFSLAFRGLRDKGRFNVIAGKLGLELRRRVKDMPVYKSVEIASGTQLLVEMLASPSFALQIVKYTECDWFPVYMNTWMMGFLSFLGPFVRGTCISDEARVIDAMSEGQSTLTLAVGSEWQDGYRSLKSNFMAIMHPLLSKTQHPYVVHATLAWLGCTVLSTNKRRRMNRETNDMLDGFLINISTILVQLSLPALEEEEKQPGYIDLKYHQGFLSLRAFGDKDVREAPLRDLAGIRGEQYVVDKMKEEEDRLREHDRQCIQNYRSCAGGDDAAAYQYYPVRESHYGVACNQCYKQNFHGIRYKCAFCDDIDICESCFAQFSRQSASAKGHIDEVLTTGLDGLQVHLLDHVFIRVGLPVPLYETRHFEVIRFEKAHFRRENNIFVDDALDPSLVCADCGYSLRDMEVSFKCSNCFDPRFVCVGCVTREESSTNPFKMHAPGHLYFAITSSWRYTYSPTTPALHFRSLSHPSALLPREASTKETEFFYLAIKSLHFGPLLTLSRLISTLKEIQELQAFCFCEEEKVKHEARQRAAAERSNTRRSSSRRPVKMSSHYTASKTRLGDLSEMRGMIELHLLEVSNVAEWLVFYARTCRWLLKLASPTQDANEEVLTDLSDAIIQFPEHFFSDLCDTIVLLGLDRLEYLDVMSEIAKTVKVESDDEYGVGSAVVEPLLVMLAQFVTSRELTRNPHLRVQALKALMALLSFFSKSKQNHSVAAIFEQNGFLQGFLVRGMLQFHEDMEKYHLRNNGLVFNSNVSSGDHLLWGFLPTRISVTLLLRYLWQIPSQRKVITNLFQLGSVPSDPSGEAAPNQLSVLVSGLWSDVAKLLDEGNSKIDTLVQLREIQESAMDGGNMVSLPFRPAMVDGYIALHSKQLRLTFRMMIEALELLSWMGDTVSLKKIMLKPELSEQCARIVSFLMSSLGTANESKSWNFSVQLTRDGKLLLANLVVLVVRCAGLSEKCSPSSFWTLIQESGGAMMNCIGDLDTHARWVLNAITTRLESARYLCEVVDEDESADEVSSNNAVDNEEEDMDEDEALALLEKQAADAVVATRSASSIASRRSSQALSIARHLGKRFVSSLAKDGRFDFTRFVKSLDMLRRENCVEEYELVDSSWVHMFVDAMDKCRDMIQLHASMDELMGDIPEEYLDPLLSTIMTDPVRLPSGQVVDRSVIERHLLSSQQVDPFTREPLTVDMLVPCDALRREIRLYLKSKMKHFKNEKEDVLATWGLAWNYMFDGGDWEESTTAQD